MAIRPWHKLTVLERAELLRRKALREVGAVPERKARPRRRWQDQGQLVVESLGNPGAIVGVIGNEIEPAVPDAVKALEDWLDKP